MHLHTKRQIAVIALAITVTTVLGYKLLGDGNNIQANLFRDTPIIERNTQQLPDLEAKLEWGTNEAICTITNLGPGTIDGKTPFRYGLYVDGIEVFSNIDSYTNMENMDSFSFNYPLSEYPKAQKLRFEVDIDNNIKEVNENNNKKEESL
ncbi:hypothetical protein KJ632_05635 [Patescibacteria group bacterium]|nr:hypothetical protein [Patescibacteria group bacterium]